MDLDPYPSPDFCKRLKRFDPNLQLGWDRSHKVWSIWYTHPLSGKRDHVMNVIEPDGSYRELDGRVFMILMLNQYYAQRPKELEEIICDSVIKQEEDLNKRIQDKCDYLNKDRTFNRKFNEVRELAASVPKAAWTTPKVLKNENGKAKLGPDGKPLMYVPHQSLTGPDGLK